VPNFRRTWSKAEYRRIPRDAPVGTYYCVPCDGLHYPGEPCLYYEDDYDERDYPEWSGVLTTVLHNPIFYHEDGEER
jgi:hypothetical protein